MLTSTVSSELTPVLFCFFFNFYLIYYCFFILGF